MKRVRDLNDYLGQFHFSKAADAGIIVNATHNLFTNLTFIGGKAVEAFRERFPAFQELYATTLAFEPQSAGAEFTAVRLAESANFLTVRECLLVNSYAAAVRIKSVLLLCAIHRDTSEADWRAFLNETFDPVREVSGVATRSARDANARITAAHFVSLFLQDSTRETELGDFLQEHPEILYGAFSTDAFVYEPYLEWQPGTPAHGDQAINPDLLVKRSDCRYDI